MKVEKKKVQADSTLNLLDQLYAEGLPREQQEEDMSAELPVAAADHPAAPAAQLPDILSRLQELQMPKKKDELEEEESIPSTPMIGKN